MTVKFNSKKFQGKVRIYRPVPGTVSILRLFVWDKKKGEYVSPERGKIYESRRYEPNLKGGTSRIKKSFDSLDEARRWQSHVPPSLTHFVSNAISEPVNLGPTFGDVYQRYFDKRVCKLSSGTQQNYKRYLRLHFQNVLQVPIRAITPSFIDSWLDECTKAIGTTWQSRGRTSFEHELSVLRCVLSFYGEYFEDPEFRFPVKARHVTDAKIKKPPPKHKDLTLEEFNRFILELQKFKDGKMMSALATVQFFQALRVSEVAALHWEDVVFDWKSPAKSVLRVSKHVLFPRIGNQEPVIADGFKNAKGGHDSVKELSLFKESFDALKLMFHIGAKGLIFKSQNAKHGRSPRDSSNLGGNILTYRQIQASYDDAFALAKLPYTGTHVLRHGGCRHVYNQTGDLAIAIQHLGNSDMDSTLVYAKRDKAAFRKFVERDWETENSEQKIPKKEVR